MGDPAPNIYARGMRKLMEMRLRTAEQQKYGLNPSQEPSSASSSTTYNGQNHSGTNGSDLRKMFYDLEQVFMEQDDYPFWWPGFIVGPAKSFDGNSHHHVCYRCSDGSVHNSWVPRCRLRVFSCAVVPQPKNSDEKKLHEAMVDALGFAAMGMHPVTKRGATDGAEGLQKGEICDDLCKRSKRICTREKKMSFFRCPKEKMQFDFLPLELKEEIFKLLDICSLSKMQSVCLAWRGELSREIYKKHVKVDLQQLPESWFSGQPLKFADSFLSNIRYEKVKKLTISGFSNNIRKQKGFSTDREKQFQSLVRVCNGLPSLETLWITGLVMDTGWVKDLATNRLTVRLQDVCLLLSSGIHTASPLKALNLGDMIYLKGSPVSLNVRLEQSARIINSNKYQKGNFKSKEMLKKIRKASKRFPGFREKILSDMKRWDSSNPGDLSLDDLTTDMLEKLTFESQCELMAHPWICPCIENI